MFEADEGKISHEAMRVCTCPSRALVQESIYDAFMERVLPRIAAIRQGHPLALDTQMGPQVSTVQVEKIESYVNIGLNEGAQLLIGGERSHLAGELAGGYYFQPTVLEGHNRMRVFQEEIFGPVLAVTTFPRVAQRVLTHHLFSLGSLRPELT